MLSCFERSRLASLSLALADSPRSESEGAEMLSCFERSQPASQLARSGVLHFKRRRRRSGDREDDAATARTRLHQLHQHLVREDHAACGEAQAIGSQIALE
jgi:hypothetical protein